MRPARARLVMCRNTSFTSAQIVGVGGEQAEVGVQAGSCADGSCRCRDARTARASRGRARRSRAGCTSASFACVLSPNTPYTTCAPACSRRSAQLMFASSSKRAISSTTTVTSLPRRAASIALPSARSSTPVRYTVCLIATTSRIVGRAADELDDRLERLVRMVQQDVAARARRRGCPSSSSRRSGKPGHERRVLERRDVRPGRSSDDSRARFTGPSQR